MTKAFGSGYFGEWIIDEFGLPAYNYTCNQEKDPKAISETHEKWQDETNHWHQVGNDRLVGIASNYGYVQIRQDEGSPKFINDYNPNHKQFGGGFGYLVDQDHRYLSTFYSGTKEKQRFQRIFGIGYYRKSVHNDHMGVDQIIFAPYGNDPLIRSQVTIENRSSAPKQFQWIEYWGCQPYQFSYKSVMMSFATKIHPTNIRRSITTQYSRRTSSCRNGHGLMTTYSLPQKDTLSTNSTQKPDFEDLCPPSIFLVGFSESKVDLFNNSALFFGESGPISPSGIIEGQEFDPTIQNKDHGLFLRESLLLQPGEKKTLFYAYGYITSKETLTTLYQKYASSIKEAFTTSCLKWKENRIQLNIAKEPWIDRELLWHHYYLRSNLTYDSYFREHIISQGHTYQYLLGSQVASRDPLQHALPFIYTEPKFVKEILRYTLKTVLPTGEIPYGITGYGMVLPGDVKPSDLELWLLWVSAEYILAHKDKAFLEEIIAMYPGYGPDIKYMTIKDLLHLCYTHFISDIGIGKHGLQRISNGDWNDMVIKGTVPPDKIPDVQKNGESVLNAAMSTYVLQKYSEMLNFLESDELAQQVSTYARRQKKAVQQQWTGHWFKRAWLSEEFGWVGEKELWVEPQPWALLGKVATQEQKEILIASLEKWVQNPSPIGAMINSHADPTKPRPAGVGINAGIWSSINGTLIMALAQEHKAKAWEEWKKNTLAYHAKAYPDIWYGIWSGPDTYNSHLSHRPGETIYDNIFASPTVVPAVQKVLNMSWIDFPVMNMHPHAWPLYNLGHLLGIHFTSAGIEFDLNQPFPTFSLKSPLVGIEMTKNSISGWYHPRERGVYQITMHLSPALLEKLKSGKNWENAIPSNFSQNRVQFSRSTDTHGKITWLLELEQ